MPTPDNSIISSHTPPRTFFVLTDNGDWMEMTPNGPLAGPAVEFYAVDLDADYDDLDHLASTGGGQLLGRAYIQDDALHLLRPEPELEPHATGTGGDEVDGLGLVMEPALRLAGDTTDTATSDRLPVHVLTQQDGRVDIHDLGPHSPADAHDIAITNAKRLTADMPTTTVAWTYTTRATIRDHDIPANLVVAEGLDADGTHVAAACLTHASPQGTCRGPWYRIRAINSATHPWDIRDLHARLVS